MGWIELLLPIPVSLCQWKPKGAISTYSSEITCPTSMALGNMHFLAQSMKDFCPSSLGVLKRWVASHALFLYPYGIQRSILARLYPWLMCGMLQLTFFESTIIYYLVYVMVRLITLSFLELLQVATRGCLGLSRLFSYRPVLYWLSCIERCGRQCSREQFNSKWPLMCR